MDEKKLEELKQKTVIDNSKLEEMMENEIPPEKQREFFNTLRDSQLYLPVTFSMGSFEELENAKVGDVHTTTGNEGFDINYLEDGDGNRAVPLFTSEKAMEESGLRSSVMVMYGADLAEMLKDSDRYAAVAINPFTAHDIHMPFGAFVTFCRKLTDEEKKFQETLDAILKMLREQSYELEENMMFTFRSDTNFMKESSVDGVFIPNVPFSMSRNPDFGKGMKYTNVLLFDKGRKVLPVGGLPDDHPDTMVAPGTEFIIKEEVDEFTTIWICGNQPFYDEL